MPIMSFIGNLSYVAVCVMGAILVKEEMITFRSNSSLHTILKTIYITFATNSPRTYKSTISSGSK